MEMPIRPVRPSPAASSGWAAAYSYSLCGGVFRNERVLVVHSILPEFQGVTAGKFNGSAARREGKSHASIEAILGREPQPHAHRAFSDGVFAIVVTLLVLELKVPGLKDHASAGELWHQLYELLPKFVSWLISFFIVCKFWLNQSHIIGMASRGELRPRMDEFAFPAGAILHSVSDRDGGRISRQSAGRVPVLESCLRSTRCCSCCSTHISSAICSSPN